MVSLNVLMCNQHSRPTHAALCVPVHLALGQAKRYAGATMETLQYPEFAPLTEIDLPWSNTPVRWQGAALGSEVALMLDAPHLEAEAAVQHAEVTLDKICAQFNLFDDASQVQHLNQNGTLTTPSEMFLDLCALATRLHVATNGLFDPTIQPLWRALFDGTPAHQARPHIGWEKVAISAGAITLQAGQKVSFNGIAQGFATDILVAALKELGIKQAAVHLGELAIIGGPVKIPLSRPLPDGTRAIFADNSALSLSMPSRIPLGAYGHILHPHGLPAEGGWTWVAVEASSAAIADGASTAFILMTLGEIEAALDHLPEITRVRLLAENGSIHDLQPTATASL